MLPHSPILLAVGEFLSHWIHWPLCSSKNSLIFLWFISENALLSSALAPTKFVPLSVLMTWTLPLLDTNFWRLCVKALVDSEFVDSIWIALLERHLKRHPYLFISFQPSPRWNQTVDSEFVDSVWIAILERHVKRCPYLFISFQPSPRWNQTCLYPSM